MARISRAYHSHINRRTVIAFSAMGFACVALLVVVLGDASAIEKHVSFSGPLREQETGSPFSQQDTTRSRLDSLGAAAQDSAWSDEDSTNADTLDMDESVDPDSVPSSGRRRQRRDIEGDSLEADSLETEAGDEPIDTTYVTFEDSTHRVQQFQHKRVDPPSVQLLPQKTYSLYLDIRSPAYKRELEIDSSGEFVTIREQVNGLDVKVPLTMSMEEYIRMRAMEAKKQSWRLLVYDYKSSKKGDDLAGFLGSITNIQIPVPSNPLLSIFGRNVINLRITGQVDIRAAFRSQTSDQVTQSAQDRTRNEPDFNQDVQINVSGTIGDKLDIKADWNTQRTFEYENQLKIKYTGFDDEIVQSVEAGNVSLQTPSLVGGGQALFGIKTKMQMGPLTLTSLLSQKKGQAKEVTVSGGAQKKSRSIFPYEYATNHFFLDTLYRKFFEPLHATQIPDATSEIQFNRVYDIQVWVSLPKGTVQTAGDDRRNAYAFIDLPALRAGERYDSSMIVDFQETKGRKEQAYFKKLDPGKFNLHDKAGYISIQSLDKNQIVAVAYRIDANPATPDDDLFFGEFLGSDSRPDQPLILKLVKPENLQSSTQPAWDMMLKNIYNIGGKDLKKEGLKVQIFFNPPGGAETEVLIPESSAKLLQALGLDRFKENNQPGPDDLIDWFPGVTVDIDNAAIIFPSLRPFDTGLAEFYSDIGFTLSDSLRYDEMYDTTQTGARNNPLAGAYEIKTEAQTATSNRIPLGAFNLVEGSVVVLLNGEQLNPGTDYSVDYIVGEVILRNERALLPGADLQVKYEQNDLFQLASKTLIGARGELAVFPKGNLGFTIMNLNQGTLSDKVRLGEEPTSNTILGIDGGTSFEAPFITDAIDALPFYRTKELSTIRISGEAAYIMPEPNTKRSPVASDENASIAFIDDFEGARRTVPFNIGYYSWNISSPPLRYVNGSPVPDTTVVHSKAKLLWYNNTREIDPVLVHEIWPNRSVRRGEDFVSVLNLDFNPKKRGMYNYSSDLTASILSTPDDNWGGIMRYISTTAGNLIDQNIAYLELWVKASGEDPVDLRRGRLYVDLGNVSEEIIPNRKLDSEDYIRTSSNPEGYPNNILNEGEDLGLDMLSNADERAIYHAFVQNNPGFDIDPDDPAGDDWFYQTGSPDVSRINGTENNGPTGSGASSASGRFPETEDLNGNGRADNDNTYLQYEIPLDSVYIDSTGAEQPNTLIAGGGINKWYQFRIPLDSPTRVFPDTSVKPEAVLQNVQYVRMWLSGFREPVLVRVAEMGLTGNQWVELTKKDSALKVSVVNIEDNPYYASEWSQIGVVRERDRTQPDQEILGNEQSLSLKLFDLPRGESRQVAKFFSGRPLDVFNYKSMKMFVHGDPAIKYVSGTEYDAEIFLRFGSDTGNYYEYRAPIQPGWHPQNEIVINFTELSSVKAARDSGLGLARIPVPNGPPGAYYGIRGKPSLTQIKYIGIGVTNPEAPLGTSSLNGEVWVNELRAVSVDDTPGSAYRFDTQIKIADFGSVGLNYAARDPNFHGISDRFGNRITNTRWALNSSVALDKFFPQSWSGTALSFSYSHSEDLTKPKYLPSTDVLVEEAAKRAAERGSTGERAALLSDSVQLTSQSLRIQDSYNLPNVRIVLPWKPWYLDYTINKLTYGFSYTRSSERSPSVANRRAWSWDFRTGYGFTLPNNLYVQPFKSLFAKVFFFDQFKDWKLYYVPFSNFSSSMSSRRSSTVDLQRTAGALARDSRTFNASKAFGFGYKLTEGGMLNLAGKYDLSTQRDLLSVDNDTVGRGFSSILKSMLFGGQDGNYTQTISVTSKPTLPNLLNITKFLDLTAGYNVGYGWRNTFQRGDIGKGAAVNSTISASANLRLKSLTDPWFQEAKAGAGKGKSAAGAKKDTSKSVTDTTKGKSNASNLLVPLKSLLKYAVKIPLLNYETINISFTQQNRVANSGTIGSTGFSNFWGRLPFTGSVQEYGPSRLYQLGLISDPSGSLAYEPKSGFPFIGWKTVRGLRAPNGQLSDQFSQSNNIALRTTRPLWEGATLEINWKVGWQFNKNTTLTTDSLGTPILGASTTTGNVERSFMSLPPFLIFKFAGSNLENVGKKFDEYKNGQSRDAALAQAFEEGLEALPFLNKVFGQFVPRANWTLRWDGLQKLSLLKSVFRQVSLEHAYQSTFRRDFRGTPEGSERTDIERITYGFSPLIGLTMGFKEFFSGSFSGSFRFGSTTSYDLNIAAQNITEQFNREISLSLSYGRRGFQLPFFGINLSNDVDVSLTYSMTKSSRRLHQPQLLASNQEGTPLEGSTRTSMEPRLRYGLSSRVSASLFFRYQKIAPDEGGSTLFGSTTNEGGLDIRILIQ